jgi:hypothetical protein
VNIYEIRIGTQTNNNKFIEHQRKVIKSEMTQKDVVLFLEGQYKGFRVLACLVEDIDIVANKMCVESKDCAEVKASYENGYEYYLSGNITLALKDVLTQEEFSDFIKARTSFNLQADAVKQRVREIYKDRPYVIDAENIKLEYNNIIFSLKLKGDVWKVKELK